MMRALTRIGQLLFTCAPGGTLLCTSRGRCRPKHFLIVNSYIINRTIASPSCLFALYQPGLFCAEPWWGCYTTLCTQVGLLCSFHALVRRLPSNPFAPNPGGVSGLWQDARAPPVLRSKRFCAEPWWGKRSGTGTESGGIRLFRAVAHLLLSPRLTEARSFPHLLV